VIRLAFILLSLFAELALANTTAAVGVTPSAINLFAMCNRQQGVAPLAVVCNTVGTTSSTISSACSIGYTPVQAGYHCIQYTWNFGDPSAGTCTTGAGGQNSKNAAVAPVAAHVYETHSATPYTVTVTAFDGTTTATATVSITTLDPEVVYAGTNTVCFFNSAVGTGCPTLATQTLSSDFDAAVIACIGTTKRCLFKKGDTFTSSTTGTVAVAGPNTIGAYGTGDAPIVNGDISGRINLTSSNVNDLRIMDLNITSSNPSGSFACVRSAASVSNVLILRVTCDGGTVSFTLSSGNNPTNFTTCTGCVIQDVTAVGMLFGRVVSGAVLGSTFGPNSAASEHVVRMQRFRYSTVSNNTLNAAGSDAGVKHSLTIRADVHSTINEDSYYFHVSDNNIFPGSTQTEPMKVSPSADTENAKIYDSITERNFVNVAYTGGSSISAIQFNEGTRATIRNNVIDLSVVNAGNKAGIGIDPQAGAQYPYADYAKVYNNTIYSGSGVNTTRGIILGTEVLNASAQNNLCYFPTGGGSTACLLDQGTGTTKNHNTGDSGTVSTDPLFTSVSPFNPAGAKPTGISYAIGNGIGVPVWSDFFRVSWPPTWSIGAVHP